ncbi:MAG: tRNA (N6-isopentenyl adenosine(37)-C2)-methylthiotransferase MiaB [Clostridia bacterium]
MAGAPRYFIRTYGCQMNERDSEIMAGQLEQLGYQPAARGEESDLIVINTCAVRASAEAHAFGYIGQLKALKDQKPGLKIAVSGCSAQEPGTITYLKKHASHVDLVFGTHNLHQLPALLERVDAEREMVIDVWKASEEIAENLPSRRAEGVQAFVNIIYGCDKFCTYCIVPFTRGREKSRQLADIVAEVEGLASEGFEDITLLGQNVNSYGHDLDPALDLADLLQAVESVSGIRWVRYLTSHPRDFSQHLIDVIAASTKITHHVHLPVQSGSSAVLKKMNRKYTREQYLDLIGRVKAAIPDAVLTTDIIVGFPGETAEDFDATLELVREVEYDAAFTFLYSPREGTPAYRWEGRWPVEEMEKKERLNRLMELQYAISLKKNQAAIGRQETVLVEGPSKKDPEVWACRSQANKVVLVPREPGEDLQNRFIPVRITGARTFFLMAEKTGAALPALVQNRRFALPVL